MLSSTLETTLTRYLVMNFQNPSLTAGDLGVVPSSPVSRAGPGLVLGASLPEAGLTPAQEHPSPSCGSQKRLQTLLNISLGSRAPQLRPPIKSIVRFPGLMRSGGALLLALLLMLLTGTLAPVQLRRCLCTGSSTGGRTAGIPCLHYWTI